MPPINEFGCPIYNQTGAEAISNFDAILASLSPELRATFEQERASAQAEFETTVAEIGYNT